LNDELILFVEDDAEIVDILRSYFEREGFRTVSASDGNTGLAIQQKLKPDLVVLDIKLPGLDGYSVLAALRRAGNVPVLMLTALAEDLDKLQALRVGADDYVVKPFNPLEVVARARAILRRSKGEVHDGTIRVGALSVDQSAHQASIDTGEKRTVLDLTKTEFRLLSHMARYPNRVFERGELVDACLPEGSALERTVDSHISNLRKKLGLAGVPEMLSGVRGVGYRLNRND
jgi:two-component system response regulator AdeR